MFIDAEGYMNNRECTLAILNYQDYDRVPVVHFGYWKETLEKWRQEGHLTEEDISKEGQDGNISTTLGFDFGWGGGIGVNAGLKPAFERKVLEVMPDGTRKVSDGNGAIILEHDDAGSIPAEVGHLLKDRASWEEHFLPRLQISEDRIDYQAIEKFKNREDDGNPTGIFCGSLFGKIRDWLGVEGVSYLCFDDEELYDEIINTLADLCYHGVKKTMETGVKLDLAYFWEDICFKNGPLVIPSIFDEKVGPHYKRITDLLKSYGVELVSLDCDGWIDALIPTWLNNGVNIMFPIEVGTWNASIEPWRQEYGRELRGVGGMRKYVFAQDYKAVDQEIERLKPLVDLGGFIPCPDHRIPPDSKWENVQYYCEQMHKAFG
jgi:uroporphyrinogen decarboxylase